MNRRHVLQLFAGAAGMSLLPRVIRSAPAPKVAAAFTYCLNTASIRGHKLGFVKELELASRAGFNSVEIWLDTLQTYLDNGGTLKDAKKRLDDLGIHVDDAIAFAEWIVDDDSKRNRALEQMKREMDLLAQIGCKRIAAPPAGATALPLLDLKRIAERYRAILELGDKSGVVPQLELWGFSKNLGKASDTMYVAMESGHPSARILLDVFHLFKGGSSLDTLPLINESAVEVLHINDYPANKPAATMVDADRIYPGDGIAPVKQILKILKSPDRPLVISFEVFNKNYYSQDAFEVVKTALTKMKAATKGV